MRQILSLLLCVIRFFISLRYRIVVRGLDQLTPSALKRPGGVLFLPNHPAEIDPIILELLLWKKFRPRPLVVEHFYYLKGFRRFMDAVGAMPLPTMDASASRWRGKKVEKQFNQVASRLKAGDNFLIYPSGRLKLTGTELLGGASFVHKLLNEVPTTNVVLVRTTGLWGSSFSRALTGSSPDFGLALWKGIKTLFKNGLFFAPRREVVVEFALPTSDFPEQGSRLELNKYLENWYNRYPNPGSEPLTLVSYTFWKKTLPTVAITTVQKQNYEERPIPKEVQRAVCARLAELGGRKEEQIERSMHLALDLGLDSLDVVQVYIFLDERYGIIDLPPGELQTVEDVLQFAAGHRTRSKEQSSSHNHKHPLTWPEEKRLPSEIPPGQTLQEVFLQSCARSGSHIACIDALTGPLSYSRLKIGALALAEKFRQLPGSHIGIMLPSSTGAYLTILGVLLAGKVPVLLNWTAGVKALDHAVHLANLQAVVTSEKFLDRLDLVELGQVEPLLHFLEEIRQRVSLGDRLKALWLSWQRVPSLLRRLNLTGLQSSDPAVILFTSGTESVPKGVPLSHANILSNQRAGMEAVYLSSEHIVYGVLPPFHSFGFSVTGLLPLFAGIRVCYAPDPTDSHGMARDIALWKPTILCAAPSFIRAVFRVARPEQLQSLKLVVSGAEKTPQELFDYVQQHLPQATVLEGYGITECSPIVTIDRIGEPHQGVGRPIPSVQLSIVDPVTALPVEPGQEGEVCMAGPSVFTGYLGSPRDPFLKREGRSWYRSGDRGYLSFEGHLILSGRLKRFVKIGGEMVSLGGLEEELMRLAQQKQWIRAELEGPPLAVSVREKEEGRPELVLFATFSIAKEEVNRALKECGLGRIVKIAHVHSLEQIPLTGAGKTHYRRLDELIA